MAKDPISQLPDLNQELGKTEKKLGSIESVLKRISGLAGTTLKGVSSILTSGVGQSTNMGLGTSGAQFSSATTGGGANVLPWLYSKKGAAAVGGVQFGLSAAAGAYNAVPDLGLTVARATGFYQSSLRTGGQMNRAGVAQATFSALGGGVTSLGSDQYVASILTQGYGYMPGTADYTRAVKEVGGAARYLGMSNEAAAEAIGGLHTGPMGGNLYQYGISTFDPKTGKARSTGEIAKQLFDRMTQGRKVTAEQMALSLREGFAGQSLRALGFSQHQQEIFGTILTNMAAGKGPTDLENAPFNPDNPTNAQMKIATSSTALMERATEPMIAGFNDAATAASNLAAFLERLPDSFYKSKGFLQGFSNTPGGSLVNGVLGGVGNAVGTIAIAAGARKALGGLAARSGASVLSPAVLTALKTGSAAPTAAKVGLGKLAAKFALKAVPVVGTALLGYEFLKTMFGTPANAAQTSQTGTQMTSGMDQGLLKTLQNAGFSGDSLNTAYGIVMAESGGNPKAHGDKNLVDKKWGESIGLFQIRSLQNPQNYDEKGSSDPWRDASKLEDPAFNAQAAFAKSKGGTDWSGWTTFNTGKYLQYKPDASSTSSMTTGNKTVNITVSLANASTAEANALAKKVKEILLNDKDLQTVGSK